MVAYLQIEGTNMAKFPELIQTCILYDGDAKNFDSIIGLFLTAAGARSWKFNQIERKPNLFYRLYGGPKLMITVEKMPQPAAPEVFNETLNSPFTKLTAPTGRADISSHACHVIIEVRHGALATNGEMDKLLDSIGYDGRGQSLNAFKQRLQICAELTNFALVVGPAILVHWTQSNQLLESETFKEAMKEDSPALLHIHPRLLAGKKSSDGKEQVAIVTYGAAHFVGQEIMVTESPVPWQASLANILVFLKLATMPNGYVIPDGDIFRPENEDFAYRVKHRPRKGDVPPYYELQPCYHRQSGYKSADYILVGRDVNIHKSEKALFGSASPAGHKLVQEWRDKEKMAQAAGGQFNVKAALTEAKPKSFFSRFVSR